jgi:Domain of unknown function (DUF397)
MEDADMNWRKSRYSNGGENACIEVASAPWRKSSYSSNGGATCVETASDSGVILVRDTTDREGGLLSVPAPEWARFTASLR